MGKCGALNFDQGCVSIDPKASSTTRGHSSYVLAIFGLEIVLAIFHYIRARVMSANKFQVAGDPLTLLSTNTVCLASSFTPVSGFGIECHRMAVVVHVA